VTTVLEETSSRQASRQSFSGCSAEQPRLLFSAQCRLLAERAERGLPIDVRSIANLFEIFRDVVLEEAA
jgi:hypothetical protein